MYAKYCYPRMLHLLCTLLLQNLKVLRRNAEQLLLLICQRQFEYVEFLFEVY